MSWTIPRQTDLAHVPQDSGDDEEEGYLVSAINQEEELSIFAPVRRAICVDEVVELHCYDETKTEENSDLERLRERRDQASGAERRDLDRAISLLEDNEALRTPRTAPKVALPKERPLVEAPR